MRPVLALLFIALLSSCGQKEKKPPPKRKKGPTMKAAAHMDGRYVPGRWTSVSVTLAGGQATHAGLLGVSYEDENGMAVSTSLDVNMPAQSRKIFRLPIRPFNDHISAWFAAAGSQTRTHIPLQLRPVATSSMEPMPHSLLLLYGKEMRVVKTALGTNDTRVIAADISAFPERWYCLESAATIIFRANALAELNEHQARALLEWVLSGGRVIADLRPGDTLPRRRIPAELFGNSDGIRIAGTDELPLAVERQVGLGTAVRVNVSITDPRLTLGRTPVLRAIVHPRPGGTACALMGVRSNRAWQYRRWVKPVPATTAFLFLLAYLALVGPVDYLVLKRLGRLEWTWYTFAAVSAIATVLALRWVYTTRVGAFTAETTSVAMLGRGGAGRTISITDIYSQKTDAYSFGAEGRKAVRPLNVGGFGGGMASELLGPGGYRISTDRGFSMESYHIPIWTHRLLRTDAVRAGGPAAGRAVIDSWSLELGDLDARTARLLLQEAPDLTLADVLEDRESAMRKAMEQARKSLRQQLPRVADEDVRFLIKALAEYRLLMDASSAFEGRARLTKSGAAKAPFSVWGRSPETTTVIWTIMQDRNKEQQ